ncbi:MAG: rod shape-determining protein MreC [Chitinophagales bacterium]|nr:rod shape-determining protein MreC [Chitinophagales bacterium]
MRNLFYLVERFHLIILLLIFESVSISFIKKFNTYQDSVISNASIAVSGEIFSVRDNIVGYFKLKENSRQLAEENAFLLAKINSEHSSIYDSISIDSAFYRMFDFTSAKVIDNSITEHNNYITINKGKTDSIEKGMGVIVANGVVGIVVNVSKNYSLVMSVLNTQSRVSVKLKKSGSIGNMVWDGNSPWQLNINNISKTESVIVGDTFVTTGYSNFFPSDIYTAVVKEVSPNPATSFLKIDAVLSYDIDKINYVYVVKPKDRIQLDSLQNSISN